MANRYIPAGREDLYRRQAIADAEVVRLEAAYKAAERKARELAQVLDRDDALVEDAEAEADRLYDEWGRAQAVADRIYQERTAGLSSWIDTSPHLPVCSACGGTGGPRLAGGGIEDARTSCRTCRGWGREDDGRGNLSVWNEKDQCWYDPATGRKVDVPEPSLDDPPKKNDPPTTRTTGPTGATTMPNIDDARAGIMAAHSSAQTGLAELSQAHSSLEDAQNGLRHATEGSNQAEADQAHGQLADAMSKIEEARSQVASALQEFEGVGQRL